MLKRKQMRLNKDKGKGSQYMLSEKDYSNDSAFKIKVGNYHHVEHE